jgi:hypothetical protein
VRNQLGCGSAEQGVPQGEGGGGCDRAPEAEGGGRARILPARRRRRGRSRARRGRRPSSPPPPPHPRGSPSRIAAPDIGGRVQDEASPARRRGDTGKRAERQPRAAGGERRAEADERAGHRAAREHRRQAARAGSGSASPKRRAAQGAASMAQAIGARRRAAEPRADARRFAISTMPRLSVPSTSSTSRAQSRRRPPPGRLPSGETAIAGRPI